MNLMAENTVKAGIKHMPVQGQKIQYTRNGKRRLEKIAAGNNPQPFVEESFGFFEDFRVFSCLKSKNFVLLLIQVEEPIGSSPVSSLMTFCILMTLMILMTFDISRYDPGDHPGDILCRLRVHHLCLTLVSHHLSCQPPRLVRPLFCNRIVLRKLRVDLVPDTVPLGTVLVHGTSRGPLPRRVRLLHLPGIFSLHQILS